LLQSLLLDERHLNRMWMFRGSQPLESGDVLADHPGNGQRARADGSLINEHRAGPALPEAATKSGIVQADIVTKKV
jgi:hypothetical protein